MQGPPRPDIRTSSAVGLPSMPGERRRHESRSYDEHQMELISRGAEFHRLFDFPPGEQLKEDFSCAWQKVILRQGRLYITRSHIAFYSVVGGKFGIHFADVAKIEKKKTLELFNNAIQIRTRDGQTYFFTSFIFRDQAHKILTDLWKRKNGGDASATPAETGGDGDSDSEASLRTRSSYEEESEGDEEEESDESDEEDTQQQYSGRAPTTRAVEDVEVLPTVPAALPSATLPPDTADDAVVGASQTPEEQTAPPATDAPTEGASTDGTSHEAGAPPPPPPPAQSAPSGTTGESDTPVAAPAPSTTGGTALRPLSCGSIDEAFQGLPEDVREQYSPTTEVKKPLKNNVLLPQGVTLVSVFEALFASDSPFYPNYREERGDKDLETPPWTPLQHPDGPECWGGYRLMTLTTKVTKPSVKWTPFFEHQRFGIVATPHRGLFVQLSSRTPEVMYGDCFRVESLFTFREQDETSVLMDISATIYFAKRTIMRSMIESTAIAELSKAYDTFLHLVVQRCSEIPSVAVPKPVVGAGPPGGKEKKKRRPTKEKGGEKSHRKGRSKSIPLQNVPTGVSTSRPASAGSGARSGSRSHPPAGGLTVNEPAGSTWKTWCLVMVLLGLIFATAFGVAPALELVHTETAGHLATSQQIQMELHALLTDLHHTRTLEVDLLRSIPHLVPSTDDNVHRTSNTSGKDAHDGDTHDNNVATSYQSLSPRRTTPPVHNMGQHRTTSQQQSSPPYISSTRDELLTAVLRQQQTATWLLCGLAAVFGVCISVSIPIMGCLCYKVFTK